MSDQIAIFPGSFDPLTIGHVSVVERALPLFSKIIVAMGVNENKRYLFNEVDRLKWLRGSFAHLNAVEVLRYEGLTVDLCSEHSAGFILRGIRNGVDHDYERSIALNNQQLTGVQTIFLPSEPAHAHISSTIVRELFVNNADITPFVPPAVRPK
jgi:pantetheine-phosphate adenylyltransferase